MTNMIGEKNTNPSPEMIMLCKTFDGEGRLPRHNSYHEIWFSQIIVLSIFLFVSCVENADSDAITLVEPLTPV